MGMVFDIQRFCLHDGAGLRTAVFLKGCPLRCRWCANPESWSGRPELFYNPDRCMGCGSCAASCPRGLIRLDGAGRAVVRRGECAACGACAEVCPRAALAVKGGEMSAAAAAREAARDGAFHAVTGGGVTVSGGEPLAQADFLLELLGILKREGRRTALETSGAGEWADLEKCLPLLDEIFVDLKHTDSARHAEWTGVGLERILDNVRGVLARRPDARLRIPIVPGFNTDTAAFRGFADFARSFRAETELLPCHGLGEGKRRLLGRERPDPGIGTETARADAERLADLLRKAGVSVSVGGSLGGPASTGRTATDARADAGQG